MLKINDVNVVGGQVVLEKVYPPEEIGLTNRWASLEGLPTRFVSDYIKPYMRRVQLRIFGKTKADAIRTRREFVGKLMSDDLVKVQFRHEDTYEMAKMESFTTADWQAGAMGVEVIFMCPYGVSFGEEKTASIGAITYLGTADTPVIFTITPSGTNLTVSNGKQSLNLTGLGTGPVVIDTGKRTITQDGVNIRSRLSISSRYFGLVPGANDFSITGGEGTVRWTERWI